MEGEIGLMSVLEIQKIAAFYGYRTEELRDDRVVAGRSGEYVSVYRNYDELNKFLYSTNKLTYANTVALVHIK